MRPPRAVLGALAGLALAVPVLPAPAGAGEVIVRAPWARLTPGPAPNGAVFFTIESRGAEPDRLVAAETPVAARAALHRHVMEGGVMRMRPVAAVEVAPGAPTVLAPGGLHVMLTGLTRPLAVGETFPLTLTFERAGLVEIQVEVRPLGAMGPDGSGQPGHNEGTK